MVQEAWEKAGKDFSFSKFSIGVPSSSSGIHQGNACEGNVKTVIT